MFGTKIVTPISECIGKDQNSLSLWDNELDSSATTGIIQKRGTSIPGNNGPCENRVDPEHVIMF